MTVPAGDQLSSTPPDGPGEGSEGPPATGGSPQPVASRVGASRNDQILVGTGATLTAAAAAVHLAAPSNLGTFVTALLALGCLAALVGRAVDRLGDRLGAGMTGVVQSALGNLPELFFSIFALRAGLLTVVQATVVGSMLGNLLLVLGLAFVAGGARHGTQSFRAEPARNAVALLSLAVAIVLVPTLSARLALPVAHHEDALSDIAAVVLLAVFVLAVPSSIRATELAPRALEGPRTTTWPLPAALAVLAATSVAAAFVSDWFVESLSPSLASLHITQSFAGLVIVAIAGNAVENLVGIQLALRDRMDYALSVILQSPIQIALFLLPLLVLLSHGIGGTPFTLVLPPLDILALGLGTAVTVIVVFDGESTWLEGVILVGLYATIAAAFWW